MPIGSSPIGSLPIAGTSGSAIGSASVIIATTLKSPSVAAVAHGSYVNAIIAPTLKKVTTNVQVTTTTLVAIHPTLKSVSTNFHVASAPNAIISATLGKVTAALSATTTTSATATIGPTLKSPRASATAVGYQGSPPAYITLEPGDILTITYTYLPIVNFVPLP